MSADFSGNPSERKSPPIRPPKPPVRKFPLRAHALGYWVKKIRSRTVYFGRWGRIKDGQMSLVAPDGAWQAALALYQQQREALEAGRTPREKSDGLTLKQLCDTFYTAKKRKVDAGEMSIGSLDEYDATCKLIVAAFGRERLVDDLVPQDFADLRTKMAERWGVVRLGNTIGRVRTIFKYAADNKLIDRPVAFGSEFVKPSKKIMRQHRAAGGPKLFTADEVRRMLDAAAPQLRAMILLGINAALGNNDCAALPRSAVDFDGSWVRFPRPKNGIDRRCPLWPETREALRATIVARPTAKKLTKPNAEIDRMRQSLDRSRKAVSKIGEEAAELTGPLLDQAESRLDALESSVKHPKPERQRDAKDSYVFAMRCSRRANAVTRAFGRLLHNLEINGRRRLGFYTLRHTFRTVADNTKDFPAIRMVMGHSSDGSIDGTYVEGIDDSRLIAVSNHVRNWLFPQPAEAPTGKPTKPKRQQRKPKAKPVEPASDGPALRLFIA